MNCPKCHGKGTIRLNQLTFARIEGSHGNRPILCDYEGCVNGIVNCCDGLEEQILLKPCQWCGEKVDSEECFAMYTGVSLICEICGKDVSKIDTLQHLKT